jgi:hypothetical protein
VFVSFSLIFYSIRCATPDAARDGNLAVVKHLVSEDKPQAGYVIANIPAISSIMVLGPTLETSIIGPPYNMLSDILRRCGYVKLPSVKREDVKIAIPVTIHWCVVHFPGKNDIDTYLQTATNDDIFTRGSIPFPLLDSFPASLFPLFTRHDTSSVTHQLIQAIVSSDMTFLRSLLCPAPSSQSPVLVNKPDGSGWSPIHHCVAMKRPSTEAVDALYQAGADVGLFTALEHYTPLHCLARREYTSTHSLYLFTVHLIQDLHAPLNAKDRDDETCIHIAAEHGECIDVLMAFLDCDKNCAVRNSPNSRGYVVVIRCI